jgi:hypothetical protein
MSLFTRLFELPFFESWLPDRLKPVNDEFISDQYSQALILETENFIDGVIQLTEINRINRTFKKKTNQVKIFLKIKKKRIRLDFSDQKFSEAPIKKRVIIDVYRKMYKAKNGVGKVVEATIYYTYQGQSHVRSVKRSPFSKGLFYKLDMLDDALMGLLVKHNEQELIISTPNRALSEKNQEIKDLLIDIKRMTNENQTLTYDPIITSRLKRIVHHIEKTVPDFQLLEIEERHMLKRVLREDLPKLLHSYTALTTGQQLEQKENIFIALSRIELNIIDLLKQMETMKLARMEHLLRLNKVRYQRNIEK